MLESPNKIEGKRFIISPESFHIMKMLRSSLGDIKQKFPEVVGMSFFGSRIIGQDNLQSDIDICIFYDGNQNFRNNLREELIPFLNGGDIYKKLLTPVDLSKTIDISKKQTDIDIEELSQFIKTKTSQLSTDTSEKKFVDRRWKIPARFFLGVGTELFENRNYVLNKLEQIEDGNEIWHYIVDSISFIERDRKTKKRDSLTSYNGYPQTIKDAREYFLNVDSQ